MTRNPLRILLQTTTPGRPDDWSIESFSLLRRELERSGSDDRPVVVTARNREAAASGSDPILAGIDRLDCDELWLFALDSGAGLTAAESAAIDRFWRRGGGLVTARDHQDVGSSLCSLPCGVGLANHFHSVNPEADVSRRGADDGGTAAISWPNYHSGRNGDFQRITAIEPVHPLLLDPGNPGRALEFFPSHPHEGAVAAPPGDPSARVIATGRSAATGRPFNLIVAFERGGREWRHLAGPRRGPLELSPFRRLQLEHPQGRSFLRDGARGDGHGHQRPGRRGHPGLCPEPGELGRSPGAGPARRLPGQISCGSGAARPARSILSSMKREVPICE